MEISEEDRQKAQIKLDKIKNSNLKQGKLPSFRPVPSFIKTVGCLIVTGIIFLVIGLAIYSGSNKIEEYQIQYDKICQDIGYQCSLTLSILSDIDEPVYIYYEIDGFYQNHRRQIKSRSINQLAGTAISASDADLECDPIVYNKNLGFELKGGSVDGSDLDPEAVAVPCGLIAQTVFNDTFAISNAVIDSSKIAWESDVNYKFKNLAGNWTNVSWIDVTDQHFIVWMKSAGLPHFRKLYGVIKDGLKIGNYTVTVQNNYNVTSFNGAKSLIVSTTNRIGGKNYFLAICYIIVGGICFIFAIIFSSIWIQRRMQQMKQE